MYSVPSKAHRGHRVTFHLGPLLEKILDPRLGQTHRTRRQETQPLDGVVATPVDWATHCPAVTAHIGRPAGTREAGADGTRRGASVAER